jgi:hypothetical protein
MSAGFDGGIERNVGVSGVRARQPDAMGGTAKKSGSPKEYGLPLRLPAAGCLHHRHGMMRNFSLYNGTTGQCRQCLQPRLPRQTRPRVDPSAAPGGRSGILAGRCGRLRTGPREADNRLVWFAVPFAISAPTGRPRQTATSPARDSRRAQCPRPVHAAARSFIQGVEPRSCHRRARRAKRLDAVAEHSPRCGRGMRAPSSATRPASARNTGESCSARST